MIPGNNYTLTVEKTVLNCLNPITKGTFVIIDIPPGFEGISNFDSTM